MGGIAIDFEKARWPMYMSPKLDGIRIHVTPDGVVSKKLITIPQPWVQDMFWKPEFKGLEGEIIVGEPTDPDVYNTTQSFVMSKKRLVPDRKVVLHVFDDTTVSPDLPFKERLRLFQARVYKLVRQGFPVACIHQAFIGTKALALGTYNAYLEVGFEGAIFRAPEGPYKFGRSTVNEGWMLKFKPIEDFDAKVVGVFEKEHNGNEATKDNLGNTKRSSHQANKTGLDTLGGLIAEDLDSGETFRCGIFKGLKAADLKRLWEEHNDGTAPLTGRYFKAQKMGYGQKIKPRHPRWIGWRDAIDTEKAT